jgi:hypothetical protein
MRKAGIQLPAFFLAPKNPSLRHCEGATTGATAAIHCPRLETVFVIVIPEAGVKRRYSSSRTQRSGDPGSIVLMFIVGLL